MEGHSDRGESLLDSIDALAILRASSDEEKSQLLEKIVHRGPVEREIIVELATTQPLRDLDDFERAHRHVMHALEVLDRNGTRQVTVPAKLGPLRPVGATLVQLAARWIVKSHVNSLATNVRRLYERREASTPWDSPAHHVLRRARIDASRVNDGMRSNPLGVPTFLIGGAFLTGTLSATLSGLQGALQNPALVAVIGVGAAVVLGTLSWVAIYAAGIARYRIRLSTDAAIADLYEAIGAAGRPQRDQSFNLAILAIGFLLIAMVVIPVCVWLVVRVT